MTVRKKFVLQAVARLILVVFTANTAFAYKPEESFWKERRKQESIQLASLPSNFPAPLAPKTDLLKKTPAVQSALKQITTAAATLPQKTQISMNGLPVGLLTHVNIRDSYKGKNASTVVILEDVHLNKEAQTHLSEAIRSFGDMPGTSPILVGLEGAEGKMLYDTWKSLKNRDIAQAVADTFFEREEISGPAHAGFTSYAKKNHRSLSFMGIDRMDLHTANVQAYKSSKESKPQVIRQLNKLSKQLAKNKKQTFNSRLRDFDKHVQDYRDGKMSLADYVQHLASTGAPLSFNVETFLQAYKMEVSFDFDAIEQERTRVLEQLVKRLTENDVNDLLNVSLAYQQGMVTFAGYYGHLRDVCRANNIDLRNSPKFNAYIQYVLLTDGIKTESLFKEITQLEKSVYGRLSTSPAELSLVQQDRQLYLASQLVEFSLTSDQWEEFKSIDHSLWSMDQMKPFIDFYSIADARSRSMVDNVAAKAGNLSVLIAGGFHTEAVSSLLKKKGLSYIVATPKITKVDLASATQYLSIFDREKTSLDRIFSGQKLFMVNSPTGTQPGQVVSSANKLPDMTATAAVASAVKDVATELKNQETLTELGLPESSTLQVEGNQATLIVNTTEGSAQYVAASVAPSFSLFSRLRWSEVKNSRVVVAGINVATRVQRWAFNIRYGFRRWWQNNTLSWRAAAPVLVGGAASAFIIALNIFGVSNETAMFYAAGTTVATAVGSVTSAYHEEMGKRYFAGDIQVPTRKIIRKSAPRDLDLIIDPTKDYQTSEAVQAEYRTAALQRLAESKKTGEKFAHLTLMAGESSRMGKGKIAQLVLEALWDDPDQFIDREKLNREDWDENWSMSFQNYIRGFVQSAREGNESAAEKLKSLLYDAKALAPAAKVNGKWFNFLAFKIYNDVKANKELEAKGYGRPIAPVIMINKKYDGKIRADLEKNDYYGLNPKDLLIFYQPLGYAVAGTVDDVENIIKEEETKLAAGKIKPEDLSFKTEADKEYAREYARQNAGRPLYELGLKAEGHGWTHPSMLLMEGPVDEPMIVTLHKNKIREVNLHNVDNMATIDDDWLLGLGMKIVKNKLVTFEDSDQTEAEKGRGGGVADVEENGQRVRVQVEWDIMEASAKAAGKSPQQLIDEVPDSPFNNATMQFDAMEAYSRLLGDDFNRALNEMSLKERNETLAKLAEKFGSKLKPVPLRRVEMVEGADGKKHPIVRVLFELRAWEVQEADLTRVGFIHTAGAQAFKGRTAELLRDDPALLARGRFGPLKTMDNYDNDDLQNHRTAKVMEAVSPSSSFPLFNNLPTAASVLESRPESSQAALFDQQYASSQVNDTGQARRWEKPQNIMDKEVEEAIAGRTLSTLTFLDLGSGNGDGGSYLYARRGFGRYIGVDFSKVAIDQFRKRLGQTPGHVELVAGDILETLRTLPNNSMDIVHAHLSLHYMDHATTQRIFQEINRVLKADGRLVMKVLSENDRRDKSGWKKIEANVFQLPDGKVTHLFSENYLNSVLDQAGLQYRTWSVEVPGFFNTPLAAVAAKVEKKSESSIEQPRSPPAAEAKIAPAPYVFDRNPQLPAATLPKPVVRTGLTVPEGQDPKFFTMSIGHYNLADILKEPLDKLPKQVVDVIRTELDALVKSGVLKAAVVHDIAAEQINVHVHHNYGQRNADVHKLMLDAVRKGLEAAHGIGMLNADISKMDSRELVDALALGVGEHSIIERNSESIQIAQGVGVSAGATNIKVIHQFAVAGATPLQKLGISKAPGFRFRVKKLSEIENGNEQFEAEFEISADQFVRYKKSDEEVKSGMKKEGDPKIGSDGMFVLQRAGKNEAIWLLALASQTNDFVITDVFPVDGAGVAADQPMLSVIYQPVHNKTGKRIVNPTLIYRSQSGADAVGGISNMVADVNFVPGGPEGHYFVASHPVSVQQARRRPPFEKGIGWFTIYGWQSEKGGAIHGFIPLDDVERSPRAALPFQNKAEELGAVMASHGEAQPFLAPFAAEARVEHLREAHDSLFTVAPKETEKDPFLEPVQARMKAEGWIRVADDKADMGGDKGHQGVPVYLSAVYLATMHEAFEKGIDGLIPSGSFSDAALHGFLNDHQRLSLRGVRGVGDDGHLVTLGDNDIYSTNSHQLSFLAFTRGYHYIGANKHEPYSPGQDFQGAEAKGAKERPIEFSHYSKRYFELLRQYLPQEFVDAGDVDTLERAWEQWQSGTSETERLPEPFSGNVTQQGIGSAGYSFDPKKERSFDILAGDKMGPAAFNLVMQEAIFQAAQSEHFQNGLVYEIWDLKAFPKGIDVHNAPAEMLKDLPTKRIFLDAVKDREAVKAYLADSDRFSVRNVWAKSNSGWDVSNPQSYLDRPLASASVTRLGILTGGEYVGKDDPLLIGNSILMTYVFNWITTHPLIVQGDMNGSHWEWAVLVSMKDSIATFRSFPLLTMARYTVSEDGKKIESVKDLFDNQELDEIKNRSHRFNEMFDKAQLGQMEPHGTNWRTVEGSYELAKILRSLNDAGSPYRLENRVKWDKDRQYALSGSAGMRDVYEKVHELSGAKTATLLWVSNILFGSIAAILLSLWGISFFDVNATVVQVIAGVTIGAPFVIAFHELGHKLVMGEDSIFVWSRNAIGFQRANGSTPSRAEALAGPLSLLVSAPLLALVLLPTLGVGAAIGAVAVAFAVNVAALFYGDGQLIFETAPAFAQAGRGVGSQSVKPSFTFFNLHTEESDSPQQGRAYSRHNKAEDKPVGSDPTDERPITSSGLTSRQFDDFVAGHGGYSLIAMIVLLGLSGAYLVWTGSFSIPSLSLGSGLMLGTILATTDTFSSQPFMLAMASGVGLVLGVAIAGIAGLVGESKKRNLSSFYNPKTKGVSIWTDKFGKDLLLAQGQKPGSLNLLRLKDDLDGKNGTGAKKRAEIILSQSILAREIRVRGIRGQTSNQTLFNEGVQKGDYNVEIQALLLRQKRAGQNATVDGVYNELYDLVTDLSAEVFRLVGPEVGLDSWDGRVSQETSPVSATKPDGVARIINEATGIFKRGEGLHRHAKIASVAAGATAQEQDENIAEIIRESVKRGVVPNITLDFGPEIYLLTVTAFLEGMEHRISEMRRTGSTPEELRAEVERLSASVNSVFVSRLDAHKTLGIDGLIDKRIAQLKSEEAELSKGLLNTLAVERIGKEIKELELLKGKAGIANTKFTYLMFDAIFSDIVPPLYFGELKNVVGADKYRKIQAARQLVNLISQVSGVRPMQRFLVASSGNKIKGYPEDIYITPLLGPNMVNTLPPNGLAAADLFAGEQFVEMPDAKNPGDLVTVLNPIPWVPTTDIETFRRVSIAPAMSDVKTKTAAEVVEMVNDLLKILAETNALPAQLVDGAKQRGRATPTLDDIAWALRDDGAEAFKKDEQAAYKTIENQMKTLQPFVDRPQVALETANSPYDTLGLRDELSKAQASIENDSDYGQLVKELRAWRKSHERKEEIDQVKAAVNKALEMWVRGEIEDVVIIGIGGSDLGARALHEALNSGEFANILKFRKAPRIHFIGDGFNASDINNLDGVVDWSKTLLIPISKSGSTPEPFAAYELTKARLIKAMGESKYGAHVLAVTGQNDKSLLFNENAKLVTEGKTPFLAMLPVPDGVGGRYSVFSPVGLIYAGISGLDIDELIAGYADGAERSKKLDANDPSNVAYQLAAQMYLAEKDGRTKHYFFPFFLDFKAIAEWFVQGFNESLGKKKEVSVTVHGAVGSTLNHSSMQRYLDGATDGFFILTQVAHVEDDPVLPTKLPKDLAFLDGKKVNGQAQAAMREASATALRKKGHPNVTLHVAQNNERALGEYMSILMRSWEVSGHLWKVNPFDQPAVEDYKSEAKSILSALGVVGLVLISAGSLYLSSLFPASPSMSLGAGMFATIDPIMFASFFTDNMYWLLPAVGVPAVAILLVLNKRKKSKMEAKANAGRTAKPVKHKGPLGDPSLLMKMKRVAGRPGLDIQVSQSGHTPSDLLISADFSWKSVKFAEAVFGPGYDGSVMLNVTSHVHEVPNAEEIIRRALSVDSPVVPKAAELSDALRKEFHSKAARLEAEKTKTTEAPENADVSAETSSPFVPTNAETSVAPTLRKVDPKDLASPIKFGTAGWRAGLLILKDLLGKVSKDEDVSFTMDNVSRLAQALATYMKENRIDGRVAVGFDARPHGRDFAVRIVEVLAANGIKADLIDQITPTPIMAEATAKGQEYALAVHITASHNPVFKKLNPDIAWQGVKVLQNGLPGVDSLTSAIAAKANDKAINGTYSWMKYDSIPDTLTQRGIDLISRSNARLREAFEFDELKKKIAAYKIAHPDFGVLVDSMHGATIEAAKIFGELGILEAHYNTTPINSGKTPKTVNSGGRTLIWAPDPTQPAFFSQDSVTSQPGKLLLRKDGDGDRAVATDIDGKRVLTPNELGIIKAHYLWTHLGERGILVRTLPSTRLLDRLARKLGTKVVETPVGSKNFAPYADEAVVALEESGHLFFKRKGVLFADSAVAEGLLLLEIIVTTGKSLTQYLNDVKAEIGDLEYNRTAVDKKYVNPEFIAQLGVLRSNKPEFFATTLAQALNKKLLTKEENGPLEAGVAYDITDPTGILVRFADDTWAMYRVSGTDGSVRIYGEESTKDKLNAQEAVVEQLLVALTQKDEAKPVQNDGEGESDEVEDGGFSDKTVALDFSPLGVILGVTLMSAGFMPSGILIGFFSAAFMARRWGLTTLGRNIWNRFSALDIFYSQNVIAIRDRGLEIERAALNGQQLQSLQRLEAAAAPVIPVGVANVNAIALDLARESGVASFADVSQETRRRWAGWYAAMEKGEVVAAEGDAEGAYRAAFAGKEDQTQFVAVYTAEEAAALVRIASPETMANVVIGSMLNKGTAFDSLKAAVEKNGGSVVPVTSKHRKLRVGRVVASRVLAEAHQNKNLAARLRALLSGALKGGRGAAPVGISTAKPHDLDTTGLNIAQVLSDILGFYSLIEGQDRIRDAIKAVELTTKHA